MGWGDEHCVLPYNRYWHTNLSTHMLDEWVLNATQGLETEETRLQDCATGWDTEGIDQAACEYGVSP